jgi:hypothetical protein
MRLRLLTAGLLASIALTGCGINDPYETRIPAGAASPKTPPKVNVAPQGSGPQSASQVIATFTVAWVNWTAATLPMQRHELLRLAAGALVGELRRQAAQDAQARLQELSGAYSRGRLIGVIARAGGGAVVVTYEQAAPTGGTPQGFYQVYLARTQRTPQGWRLTEWQPTSGS